jgi:cellobiose-specific phosphotransferase system component IIC
VITLRQQQRRRRKQTDTSFWFFRGAMVAALLAAGMAAALLSGLATADWSIKMELSIGALLLGAFASVINGMFYKIVPFINWLHLETQLQRSAQPGTMPPGMNQMLNDRSTRFQMVAHFTALVLLLAAIWWPALARPAGFAWASSSAWLGINLIYAVSRYRYFRNQIRSTSPN